ncbi:MAG: flagellar basal body-associated FliL family protein [Myxococcota bacterium]
MDDEDDEYIVQSGGGGNMMMTLIVGVVGFLLGAGAGFGGAMFLAEEPECETEAEGEMAELGPQADERVMHSLGRFTVNLRGTGGGRVLRMEVQVEIDGTQQEMVEAKTPLLRDAVLTLASDYTFGDLEGLDGKMRFRDELLARLNSALSVSGIRRIYFTEFVVQ